RSLPPRAGNEPDTGFVRSPLPRSLAVSPANTPAPSPASGSADRSLAPPPGPASDPPASPAHPGPRIADFGFRISDCPERTGRDLHLAAPLIRNPKRPEGTRIRNLHTLPPLLP